MIRSGHTQYSPLISITQEHGGDIYYYASLLGIRPEEIIDFSANINPLGPSRRAKEALFKSDLAIVNYPDPSCRELRETIAFSYKIDPENIIIGNGSTEFICLIPHVIRHQVIIIPIPTFSGYEREGRVAGSKITLIKNTGHTIDLARIASAFSATGGLLFLCNPNNPTGELIRRYDLLDIIDKAARANIIVVVDEAFIDYIEEESLVRDAQEGENLIVLRSFTKFFALPGLRVGYLVSNRRIIKGIKEKKEPWSVNSLAQIAASESLKDRSYIKEGLLFMEQERMDLYGRLKGIDGIKPYPSYANFILIRIEGDGLGSDELFGLLLKRRIAVRNCKTFAGLDGEFIRVAVKGRAENSLLVDSLRSIILGRP